MAAKPSSAAEEALQKIEDQITCGICLEPYKQPRLLKCFHVFCEQCLQRLVHGGREGQSLPCPQCRQDTPLPVGGVTGLQGAFYIHYLFDIQDTLKKVSSGNRLMCSTCSKREAVCFCRTCRFVCKFCEENHQYWANLKTHEIIDFDTLTRDVTTLVPPLKNTLFCPRHQEKEADLYCETCDDLICRDCIVRVHRDHQYDLVPESFAEHMKAIADSLKPVGEQIALLERAIKSVGSQRAAVIEQKTAVVAEIRTSMAHLRQAIEVRESELVGQAEQAAETKLNTLAVQQEKLELPLAQLKSCQDFVQESRRTCSQGEILKMKSPVMKLIKDLTGSFKPDTLPLSEQADMVFGHNLPEVADTCQQFGRVFCHPVVPEKCQASGEGIKVAMRGQTVAVSVEAVDMEGKAYLRALDTLRCELVATDGSNRVSGTVKRRNQNTYDISYKPQVTGEHQLHILIEEHSILNSPFTVTVLPNLTAPEQIIGDLNKPWRTKVGEGGEVVVAERDCHLISIFNPNGERKFFGTFGSKLGELNNPEGVAIDIGGNILVADYNNHRIQQFSPSGKHLQAIGCKGNGPCQFHHPVAIEVHPHTQGVYVTDCKNHRIQVLHPDLTHSSSFGCKGSNNGEFTYPSDVSTDREGNVYVADRNNHRIQVFTVDGVYLRQFGKKGEGEGELKQPVGIAIGSGNEVYVSEWENNRISIFSTDGEFIKSFGRQGNGPVQFYGPFGLAVDRNGALYVCDAYNGRLQTFN